MDEIKVGDDAANKARQAFMSFDISTIPAGAKIEDAALNISGVPLGHPFNQLGPLGIYYDDYGSIDPSDFNSSFSGHIKTYTSLPTASFSNAELINRLQSSVNAGDSRFQIRLQFQKYTDHNGKVDMWQVNSPELIVRYVK